MDALQNQTISAIVMSVPEVDGVGGSARHYRAAPAESATAEPAATPPPGEPLAILLALDPQDALFSSSSSTPTASWTSCLRHPTNEELFSTDTVTLEYIRDLYGMPGQPLTPGQ